MLEFIRCQNLCSTRALWLNRLKAPFIIDFHLYNTCSTTAESNKLNIKLNPRKSVEVFTRKFY